MRTKRTTPARAQAPTSTGRRYRVLVTGSRTWRHIRELWATLDRLLCEHGDRLVIVHGACPRGVDALTDLWCRVHGVDTETHPADWRWYGRAAGPIRNAAMVATDPNLCMAFIRNASAGATGCADLAEAAGIPTVRHEWHDQPSDGARLTVTATAGRTVTR